MGMNREREEEWGNMGKVRRKRGPGGGGGGGWGE